MLSVLNRIQCGMGRFCLAFLARIFFVLKVFWDGIFDRTNHRKGRDYRCWWINLASPLTECHCQEPTLSTTRQIRITRVRKYEHVRSDNADARYLTGFTRMHRYARNIPGYDVMNNQHGRSQKASASLSSVTYSAITSVPTLQLSLTASSWSHILSNNWSFADFVLYSFRNTQRNTTRQRIHLIFDRCIGLFL